MVAYPSVHRHDERPEPSIGIPSALIHDDRQRRERRFEAMRKISEVTPGPLGIECVLVEKRIELSDKRRDFAWQRACYALGTPGADTLQVALDDIRATGPRERNRRTQARASVTPLPE